MTGPDQRHRVVLGVDIGTTSTKTVAYDVDGHQLASHSVGYPLDEPHPGYAEQDPQLIFDAVVETIRTVVTELGAGIAGLSFSTAMHSLIGLDPDGVPLTPSVTWADSRASSQAERLRAAPSGLALHRRTGTPVHPMAPLSKLLWFAEQEPKLHERVAHWVGIKDYVLLRLCRRAGHRPLGRLGHRPDGHPPARLGRPRRCGSPGSPRSSSPSSSPPPPCCRASPPRAAIADRPARRHPARRRRG